MEIENGIIYVKENSTPIENIIGLSFNNNFDFEIFTYRDKQYRPDKRQGFMEFYSQGTHESINYVYNDEDTAKKNLYKNAITLFCEGYQGIGLA